jgi:nitroreductase
MQVEGDRAADSRGQVVLDALATMRSIRRYKPEPVPENDLAKILYAASRAPSPGNRQPARFVILSRQGRGAEARRLLGEAFRTRWKQKVDASQWWEGSGLDPSSRKARAGRAMEEYLQNFESTPVVILVCMVVPPSSSLDVGSRYEGCAVFPSVENLLIAARALGYGGTMSCWHDHIVDELREVLEIPENVLVSAVVTLGRPVGGHGPLRRRSMSQTVYIDGLRNPAPWAVDPPMSRFVGSSRPT